MLHDYNLQFILGFAVLQVLLIEHQINREHFPYSIYNIRGRYDCRQAVSYCTIVSANNFLSMNHSGQVAHRS